MMEGIPKGREGIYRFMHCSVWKRYGEGGIVRDGKNSGLRELFGRKPRGWEGGAGHEDCKRIRRRVWAGHAAEKGLGAGHAGFSLGSNHSRFPLDPLIFTYNQSLLWQFIPIFDVLTLEK